MDAQIYRARQAEALAALDTADSYRQTLYATERGALRALGLDGALTLAGQAGGCKATSRRRLSPATRPPRRSPRRCRCARIPTHPLTSMIGCARCWRAGGLVGGYL
ncbi:hypothetical protein D8I24_6649 (plasmid) [Cupriavidus necator H850]|uniref:hypothetical protein n=1 Tax=Cupriavidus necator TaxID=106590 RepID=UPI001E474C58|nr:hypothetical protein [Cupriavidus necator]KAI3597500.1 hypothetical protein D8I24_6649 [Cupriavidus necator H850]